MKTYARPFCNKHDLYFILKSGNEIKTKITKLKKMIQQFNHFMIVIMYYQQQNKWYSQRSSYHLYTKF